jgi:hypothetical protein
VVDRRYTSPCKSKKAAPDKSEAAFDFVLYDIPEFAIS